MPHVELVGLAKVFGAFQAIQSLDLAVGKGEFCALLGPSGCGKSTLLRMIAGLEDATAGEIRINGRDVTDLAPADRQIAMVFQSYALYPHMTVAENIAFSLEVAGMKKAERLARAAEVGRTLQLGELMDRRPALLSGGQRQRVAIGRALVRNPEVFLFDEPLSNLDAMLRVQMRMELSSLHHDLAATMIYVTHDQVEAMTMADRIVVLDQGRIMQVGAPLELYERPANRFVAAFIGSPSMNFLAATVGQVGSGTVTVQLAQGGGKMAFARTGSTLQSGAVVEVGVRPEHATLVEASDPAATMTGLVRLVERLGSQTLVHLETPAGPFTLQGAGTLPVKTGERPSIAVDATHAHLFDAGGTAV
ncbi:MAG: ABC transporter ATP-binding protein [bacterium]